MTLPTFDSARDGITRQVSTPADHGRPGPQRRGSDPRPPRRTRATLPPADSPMPNHVAPHRLRGATFESSRAVAALPYRTGFTVQVFTRGPEAKAYPPETGDDRPGRLEGRGARAAIRSATRASRRLARTARISAVESDGTNGSTHHSIRRLQRLTRLTERHRPAPAEEDTIENRAADSLQEPQRLRTADQGQDHGSRNPVDPSGQRRGPTTTTRTPGQFGVRTDQNNKPQLQLVSRTSARRPATSRPTEPPPFSQQRARRGLRPGLRAGEGSRSSPVIWPCASGFGQASNNGLKNVASSTATTVVVTQTAVDDAPGDRRSFDERLVSSWAPQTTVDNWAAIRTRSASWARGLNPAWQGDGAGTRRRPVPPTPPTTASPASARSRPPTSDRQDRRHRRGRDGHGQDHPQLLRQDRIDERDANTIKRRTCQLERTRARTRTAREYQEAVQKQPSLQIRQADKVTVDPASRRPTTNSATAPATKSGARPDLGRTGLQHLLGLQPDHGKA